MAKVTIYTRQFCGFCTRALGLLDRKGVEYEHIDAGMSPDLRRQMIDRAGGAATFPQIFIGEKHIGGSDELHALDRSGKLDAMLEG